MDVSGIKFHPFDQAELVARSTSAPWYQIHSFPWAAKVWVLANVWVNACAASCGKLRFCQNVGKSFWGTKLDTESSQNFWSVLPFRKCCGSFWHMLTTVWMRAVDELEGAVSVTVHSLPPIPPKLEEPKELRYRRKPSQSTAVSRFRPPPAPSRCVMKTFGSGIDQFEYWEHSNPCTCGHGPPPPPQQSQPPHPSSAPEPARDGLVEEEMAASEESPPPAQ